MIKELSELGKLLRSKKTDNPWVHDALKDEYISMELIIGANGEFQNIQLIDDKLSPAEAITAKKGKARLLLDKAEEVLCFGGSASKKKHQWFLDKLAQYTQLPDISPVLAFYKNSKEGLDKALAYYETLAATDDKKAKRKIAGNIGFRVKGEPLRIHEKPEVLQAVIAHYESSQREQTTIVSKQCSVCGRSDYPVIDVPHGMVKQVPGGRTGGCALISYNGDHNPFESYDMIGNENSGICTNCAKTYIEGLSWLLTNGVPFKNKKNKDDLLYSNRWPKKKSASFSVDTAMIYWTRDNRVVNEIDQLEAPTADDVTRMIESLTSGKEKDSNYLEPERFYSCTLSGAAARIAVRDWIETSLGEFRKSIVCWFKDIAILRYDKDQKKIVQHFAPLYDLARSCQRKHSDGSYDKDDTATARVAGILWKAALQNAQAPLPDWILIKVLQRARLDKKGVTEERAALIKLILNRNIKGGGFMISESKAEGQRPVAYICGQIFATMESIQYWASSGERNAGIRERFFTYAMTMPAAAFGRLFDLSSKHLKKLKNEKPGHAINLDKELQYLVKDIDIHQMPTTFSLEQKGQFAIGYYHQRQEQFSNSKSN